MKRTIFIAGNPDLAIDALPPRLLEKLRAQAPEFSFAIKDPNEEWESDDIILIDTALGIEKVTLFSTLDHFAKAPHLTLHDFDALSSLLLLKKLGKLKKISIIGVPPTLSEEDALKEILAILHRHIV